MVIFNKIGNVINLCQNLFDFGARELGLILIVILVCMGILDAKTCSSFDVHILYFLAAAGIRESLQNT